MSELYIGFMSGTSLDGIDASLIRTNGIDKFEPIENIHIPYPANFIDKTRELFLNMGPFLDIEKELTELHIETTHKLLKKAKLTAKDIKAIGFHGQTIFHNPNKGITLQIGNPHLLAQKTSIDVIHDFRRRDVSLGGQGAPLVPIFHKLLMQKQDYPVSVVNIGGVANITYIDQDNLIAFDTGPGCALINDAMLKYYNLAFDANGQIASNGKIDKSIIEKVLISNYFKTPYPKSLDRNEFSFLEEILAKHEPSSIIATLTYLTATSIVESFTQLPQTPKKLFLCGGGSKNIQIISWIKEILQKRNLKCNVENISNIDKLDPDYIESQAFAYMAARFYKDLPSAFPSTTNADRPNICGCLTKAN